MYYKEFKNMGDYHRHNSESASGSYLIRHVEVKESDAFEKVRNPELEGQLDQNVCVLVDTVKGEIVMSDSWMEQETNIEFVRAAKGDVLIGGLGMGMILLALQDKSEVTSITVVEISQELVDFILPNLPLNDKVKIVVSDIHDFIPDKKYDLVYCDIWNDISGNNYDEMNDLTHKFREHKAVAHWRFDRTEEMHMEDDYYGY